MTLVCDKDGAVFTDGEWIDDKYCLLNTGITQLYALREMNKHGDDPGLFALSPLHRWAYLLESAVGKDLLAEAYFCGNTEKLISCVNELCEDPDAWGKLTDAIRQSESNPIRWQIGSSAEETIIGILYKMILRSRQLSGEEDMPRGEDNETFRVFIEYAKPLLENEDIDSFSTEVGYYLANIAKQAGVRLLPELELGVFKELKPEAFLAFFSCYVDRSIAHRMFRDTHCAAMRRTVFGDTMVTLRYEGMIRQIYAAIGVLTKDKENMAWVDANLPVAQMSYRYAARLTRSIPAEVVRHLCG